MRHYVVLLQALLLLIGVPTLACGPAAMQVTPTPTKTPKIIQLPAESPTPTAAVVDLPTFTPVPEIPPTDTPLPPTDTPIPEPPTDTPPPPPTNTPPPPPPPPTEPPSSGPAIVIDLPDGDTFNTGDEVRVRIIVSDPEGVSTFTWGVFTENGTPVVGGDRGCGNSTQCEIEEEFEAQLPGAFRVGVEALDRNGQKSIEVRSIYVG